MINKVILIGNVGADPEIRTLENGVKVARVRLATTERIFNRQTQESHDHTEWHSVTLWRGLADVADRFVRKGSQIYIEGRIRSRDWTDEAGNKRYAIEIQGDEMKLLGRRSDNPAAGEGFGGGQSYAGGQSYTGGQSYAGAPQGSAPSGGSSLSGGSAATGGSAVSGGSAAPAQAAPAAASTPQPDAPAIPDEDPDDLPF